MSARSEEGSGEKEVTRYEELPILSYRVPGRLATPDRREPGPGGLAQRRADLHVDVLPVGLAAERAAGLAEFVVGVFDGVGAADGGRRRAVAGMVLAPPGGHVIQETEHRA